MSVKRGGQAKIKFASQLCRLESKWKGSYFKEFFLASIVFLPRESCRFRKKDSF